MSDIILKQGDCFELLKSIEDKSISLILTDPPYLFNRGGGKTKGTDKNAIGGKSELYKFGNMMMDKMGTFDKDKIYALLDESKRVLKVMRGYYFVTRLLCSIIYHGLRNTIVNIML